MNIREEYTERKEDLGGILSRSSIPVLSTKHFLENGKVSSVDENDVNLHFKRKWEPTAVTLWRSCAEIQIGFSRI